MGKCISVRGQRHSVHGDLETKLRLTKALDVVVLVDTVGRAVSMFVVLFTWFSCNHANMQTIFIEIGEF